MPGFKLPNLGKNGILDILSWMVLITGGPMGPTCDLDRLEWDVTNECYYSCPLCDELTSCDWTTCYDDIGFIDYVINHVADYWCIDMNQIHLSGISNGGSMYFFLKY